MRELKPEEVRAIRDRLDLSREDLGRRIGVTPEAIRAWESGKNPCNGPSAILLTLLDRQPRILDAIDQPRRPRPDAPEGSPEWLALQRILGLMQRAQNLHRWSAVVAAYDLDGEWIDAMIGALLLSRAPGAERTHVTAVAEIRFRLHDWAIWFQRLTFDREPPDPASVPLMPREALLAAE